MTQFVHTSLQFIPPAEIGRALAASNDPVMRTRLFAAAARINTLYMIGRAGSGHIGSSFSSLDIVCWLYLNELAIRHESGAGDVFFSSKGHDAPGFYSVLIGLGLLPAEMLERLRRLGGLPGHPDVGTPHVATNTGSLGMGISKAKGMIEADRRVGRSRRYVVMTGDGELQEGQIWESLQGAANRKLSALTVVVDHNKIQSDHWVRETADLGDLQAKFAAFNWNVLRCDGHDFPALRDAFTAARDSDLPTVIIADTVKGKGVWFMEPGALGPWDFYAFHSGPLSPEHYASALAELTAALNTLTGTCGIEPLALEARKRSAPAVAAGAASPHRIIPAYADALVDAGRRRLDIVALDADLVLDCGVVPFRDAFPDRYIECGIAEQDMVSMAGGLALGGRLPIVHSFACFLTPRANEQIYNNATERTKVIYVGSLAGLLPAGPGHSHQSVRDIALMASVPGMTIIEPSSGPEAAAALEWMVQQADGPCYLRLISIPVDLSYDAYAVGMFGPGRGTVLTEGDDAIVFAYGPVMLSEAVTAAGALAAEGLGVRVVNLPWLNRLDTDWLHELIGRVRHVFTIDNHYRVGGQGELIAATIAELGLERVPRVTRFAIDRIPACGDNDEVLRSHKLDRASLATRVSASLSAKRDGDIDLVSL